MLIICATFNFNRRIKIKFKIKYIKLRLRLYIKRWILKHYYGLLIYIMININYMDHGPKHLDIIMTYFG